ncbi:MAG TPA: fimbria/pilus outer membrane usher protein [Rhodanobacteraceae bacterium]|nr:fimbria/pilus outer membrane usher protein [Rhodanobacteraceae bacterium]
MANRPSRRCRLARRLASGLLSCAVASDLLAEAPDAGYDPASAIEVIADAAGGSATGGGEVLYLEVVLNGNETHKLAGFSRTGDAFRASADTLRQLGFRLPKDSGESVDLGALPDVSYRYDASRQRIEITASERVLDQDRTVLNPQTAEIPQPSASNGLLLNYDLYGTRDDDENRGLSTYTELRAFGAYGVISNTWLSRVSDSPGSDTHADSARLDTTWTYSFVDSANVLRVGDSITGNLPWSRSTRFGGIQLQRDFALQPDLITFPIPQFLGQAAVPSTVDLYVNGLRRYSGETPAGPFQLGTVPIVNGAGNAQVVVTDALGRQTTYDFPFYTTSQLLKQGLSDYSLELGFVRKDYGTASFEYASDPAASAVYRRGITDSITGEAHAEAISGLANGGAGGVVQIGDGGTLTGSYAYSSWHGRDGHQGELGYSWRNTWFNFAIDSMRSFGDYRDVASLYGPPPPRRTDRALVGVTYAPVGSFGANYVELTYPGQPRSRFASAFYFKSLGTRFSLSFSVNQNLDDHSDRSAFVGLSMSFGSSESASLSAQHDSHGNYAAVDVSRPISPDGGYGWHVRAQDGAGLDGGQAEFGYRGDRAQTLVGAQTLNDNTLAYGELTGALVLMDSHVFAARRIDDAFAVVATGAPNVPVMLENRVIGETDSSGDLLVTPLNAYQRNRVSIDPMRLPADARIERVDGEIVPADRSGVLVNFRVAPVEAAAVVLHDAKGDAVALGSAVELNGDAATPALVGYDGAVYLEGIKPHNTLRVHAPSGDCSARFDYRYEAGSVPTIGPLVCTKD